VPAKIKRQRILRWTRTPDPSTRLFDQYVKEAVNNRKVLYGSKPGFVARQITFVENETEGSTKSKEMRELVSLVKNLVTRFDNVGTSNQLARSRTPSPIAVGRQPRMISPSLTNSPDRLSRLQCYFCREYGHLQRDCGKQKTEENAESFVTQHCKTSS